MLSSWQVSRAVWWFVNVNLVQPLWMHGTSGSLAAERAAVMMRLGPWSLDGAVCCRCAMWRMRCIAVHGAHPRGLQYVVRCMLLLRYMRRLMLLRRCFGEQRPCCALRHCCHLTEAATRTKFKWSCRSAHDNSCSTAHDSCSSSPCCCGDRWLLFQGVGGGVTFLLLC